MNINASVITVLGNLLKSYGITDVIVSPGSRNAPIVFGFKSMNFFNLHSIVDERSAAFIGLGIALKTNKPVALICTSGSAVLNYAPAIAEAFYQKIPLVAITADRPPALIDQLEGQTINQLDVFKNYIRYSANLPASCENMEDIAYVKRLINQALIRLSYPTTGPVHINVPLKEPLYGNPITDKALLAINFRVELRQPTLSVTEKQKSAIRDLLSASEKTMIIVGQFPPKNDLSVHLKKIEQLQNIVILTEHTSNICTPDNIGSIDRTIAGIKDNESYSPDLLITLGDAIVSKKIKRWLIDYPPEKHIHFTEDAMGTVVDTFQSITDTFVVDTNSILEFMSTIHPENPDRTLKFFKDWTELSVKSKQKHLDYLKGRAFTDLMAFDEIFKYIPKDSFLHLSNSSPVRYAQLFDIQSDYFFLSNRGVSGIDGSISTAVGYAVADPKMSNTIITGELGFLYDSNALFNRIFPNNLIVIVINNRGGNIFKIIPGPTDFEGSEELIIFDHQFEVKGIAENYGISYKRITQISAIKPELTEVYESKKAHIIEIMTPSNESAETLKDYFKYIEL